MSRRLRTGLYSAVFAGILSVLVTLAALPVLLAVSLPRMLILVLPLASFAFIASWLHPRYRALFMLQDAASEGRSAAERQAISSAIWGLEGFAVAGVVLGQHVAFDILWIGCTTLILVGSLARRSILAAALGLAWGFIMLVATRPRLSSDELNLVRALRVVVASNGRGEDSLAAARDALETVVRSRNAHRTSAST